MNNTIVKSVILEQLTWVETEEQIKEVDACLIALGARTKEHGPHLPLNTDYLIAEYLKKRLSKELKLLILPTIQYGYYPAFVEYPGSVSIRPTILQGLITDICLSISNYGLKKFYILNTGISTIPSLLLAKAELSEKGILMNFFNFNDFDNNLPPGLIKQEGGTHADEVETSIMLYIAPDKVNMSKAIKDYDNRPNLRGFSRIFSPTKVFSPSGIYGDPTLATSSKGKIIVELLVKNIKKQIINLINSEI